MRRDGRGRLRFAGLGAAVLGLLAFPGLGRAAGPEEAVERAKALQLEGVRILRENRGTDEAHRGALEKFLEGSRLLEAAAAGGTRADEIESLQEEMNALIYWTRKCMTLHIIPAAPAPPVTEPEVVRKPPTTPAEPMPRADSPLPTPSPELPASFPPAASPAEPPGEAGVPGATPAPVSEAAVAEEMRRHENALAALAAAEAYAKAHPDKKFEAAIRFFVVGDMHKGTLASQMALDRALRLLDAEAAARAPAPTGPGGALVAEGDARALEGDSTAAARAYERALAAGAGGGPAGVSVRRKLGHARFRLATEHKNDYFRRYAEALKAWAPEHNKAVQELVRAWNSKNRKGVQAANQKIQALQAKHFGPTKAVAAAVRGEYVAAAQAFQEALAAAGGNDLDSELHLALIHQAFPTWADQQQARTIAAGILRRYRPETIEERILYLYAREFLDFLTRGPARG